jgi:hypothetical protein
MTSHAIAENSHLMGMFYRTLRIIDNGIKPCYVFDGAPPTLKNGEVALFNDGCNIVAGKTICKTGGGIKSSRGSERNRYIRRS